MAVIAALVAMAATLVTDSTRMPRAAVVVAYGTRSVVDVFDDLSLWWRGAVSAMSVQVRVATDFSRMRIGELLT